MDLVEELRTADNASACLELLSESRRVLGFGIVGFRDALYAPIISSLSDAERWASRFGWPEGFMGGWINDGHATHFPYLDHCRRHDAPWHWELFKLVQGHTTDGIAPAHLAAVQYMRQFELTDGITVTVRRPFRKLGCLSWINAHERRTVANSELQLMQRISSEFFEAIDHFGGWQSGAPLSLRGRECLQLASSGLSDKKIAELIGRSVDTVRFHMNGAIRQLDAVNRTHAVAIGISNGLIAPPAVNAPRRDSDTRSPPRRCTPPR